MTPGYRKFDPSKVPIHGDPPAKIANPANPDPLVSNFSNFSNEHPINGDFLVTPDVVENTQRDEIQLEGVYMFTNPQTQQRFVTYFYRCTVCTGTNWGPSVSDPEVWHCLVCAAGTATA